MQRFENMFEGYEWKSMEFQNKLVEMNLVNDENKEVLTELFVSFFDVEEMMMVYKMQKEAVENTRDRIIAMKDEKIEALKNRIKELENNGSEE